VFTTEFPAGTTVDLPDDRRPAGWRVAVEADADGARVHRAEVALPAVPLLWYVEIPEPQARPPATTLVAFSDHRYADGTVLPGDRARAAGVRNAEQVAALRWWPGTGRVHQVYVSPEHRRKGLAGKVLHAAFGIQRARGLPDLHGDGQRTDLGELFVGGLPEYAAGRWRARTHRLPSMDPPT
jgi:GNAT superfamily N-acetyltransferase